MPTIESYDFQFTNTLVCSVQRAVVSDLTIEEFDQWSNPTDGVTSPTTMCWCRVDAGVGALG